MFFLGITKNRIGDNLQSDVISEINVGPVVITVATDNFLSTMTANDEGFSIIESPSQMPESKRIVLSLLKFNNDRRTLDIYRPTISSRPIYYHFNTNGEFFCSTHINMLRKAGVKIEENTKNLPEFFIYRYVMPPKTLYKDIKQLQTGSRLQVKIVKTSCMINGSTMFDPPYARKTNNNISTNAICALNKTCEKLTPVTHRLAMLLSGGLDSSLLLKICQNLFDIDTTYSAGYPFELPSENVEKKYAISAAKMFGTKHLYFEPGVNEFLSGLLEAIAAAEEPLHHMQSVLLYLLCKNDLAEENDVVISGLGADGIFGSSFHSKLFEDTNIHNRVLTKLFGQYPLINSLNGLSQLTGRGKRLVRKLYCSSDSRAHLSDINHILWQMGIYGDSDWAGSYFGASAGDIIANRCAAMRPYRKRSIFDMISIMSFIGSTSVSQAIWSKLAEANHKAMLYPFTDTNVIEMAFKVSWDKKLSEPKSILRQTARQLCINEAIISRPKSGWGIDTKKWGPRGGIFEPMVPLISKAFDEKQIRLMQSGEERKAMTFWNILNYAIWKRLCINCEPLDVLKAELLESIYNCNIKTNNNLQTVKG